MWPGRTAVENSIETALAASASSSASFRVRLLMNSAGQLQVSIAPLPALQAIPFVALTDLTLDSREFLLKHKTTYRPWYESTTRWLAEHDDYFDLIFLNERAELCEGSRSNVYLKRDKLWVTPPLNSGLLGGVQRQYLLDTGQVREAVITKAEFEQTEIHIRLSNGLRGWFDVQRAKSLFPGRDFP
jgi:4-amino-4-deoxychorismate lyase